jgi:hypothetical protein
MLIYIAAQYLYYFVTASISFPWAMYTQLLFFSEKKPLCSSTRFRSSDLWVMSPTRFLCATELTRSRTILSSYTITTKSLIFILFSLCHIQLTDWLHTDILFLGGGLFDSGFFFSSQWPMQWRHTFY